MIHQQQEQQQTFEHALLSRNRTAVSDILQHLSTIHSPTQIIDTIVIPALEHIGTAWEQGTIALSQVYMSGRMCEEIVDVLLPPDTTRQQHTPKIAIAVLHDYHVLGKRIVSSVLRTRGYELLDYGHGIEVDQLVHFVRNDHVKIVLISTLMLPSALLVQDVCKQLKQDDDSIKIIVGGAPFRFDDQLWKAVGADAMGKTASDAIGLVARYSRPSSDPISALNTF